MSSWYPGLELADGVLVVAVMAQAALLGANLFEYVVSVPNWRQPDGLVAYRTLMRRRHPGHFFQTLVPVTTLLLIAALILGWRSQPALIGAGLASVVIAEVFTLIYFMPRNRALFLSPVEAEPGALSMRLIREWSVAAVIRLAIVSIGVLAGLVALARP